MLGLDMTSPSVVLGVPLMDDDHARLEMLLERVGATKDKDLPALLVEIESETRAHFMREEELMRSRQAPILSCHIVQHELFLSRFAFGHGAVRRLHFAALRDFLAATVPRLLSDHINTVDRVTSEFLRMEDGELQPGLSSWPAS